MASLLSIPDELQLLVCEYLEGDAGSLEILALVCWKTRACALEIHKRHPVINLIPGNGQVIHRVLTDLQLQADDITLIPLNITIVSTGGQSADRVLKFASSFTTIRIRFIHIHDLAVQVNQHALHWYMLLASRLEPYPMNGTMSLYQRLPYGDTNDLVRLLLTATQHITTLEMEGTLDALNQNSL